MLVHKTDRCLMSLQNVIKYANSELVAYVERVEGEEEMSGRSCLMQAVSDGSRLSKLDIYGSCWDQLCGKIICTKVAWMIRNNGGMPIFPSTMAAIPGDVLVPVMIIEGGVFIYSTNTTDALWYDNKTQDKYYPYILPCPVRRKSGEICTLLRIPSRIATKRRSTDDVMEND